MELLNFDVLEKSGYSGYVLKSAPEKALQFGEGNFLRAFAEYWFDLSNEKAGWNGKIAMLHPRPSNRDKTKPYSDQEGLYTLYLRGSENGEKIDSRRVISSVSRLIDPYSEAGFDSINALMVSDELEFIISNTTEAGIVYDPTCSFEDKPALSFPAKLTQYLYTRFKAGKGGLVILSCELIDNNGKELLKCVNQHIAQWGLEKEFSDYINNDCLFCSTLVDRIVPGSIKDADELARLEEANGYADKLSVVGEVFGVWVIEGPEWLAEKLPFKKAGANCIVVPDITPYKKRKVRILNGAHTGFVPGAYLAGFNIVRDCMHNDTIRSYMNKMLYEEVIPTLPLDKDDLMSFASAVQDRFNNPFINHELLSICLNSTSKWRARNLPSLLEYMEINGQLPKCLTMSFALYLAFFTSNVKELNEKGLVCSRSDGTEYVCSDDKEALEMFFAHKDDTPAQLVKAVASREDLWGLDLTTIPGFENAVVDNLTLIRIEGAMKGFEVCL